MRDTARHSRTGFGSHAGRRPRPLRWLAAVGVVGCTEAETFKVMSPRSLRTHYLLDYVDSRDTTRLVATVGHLIVFNPGARDADLAITAYYESEPPSRFTLRAPAGATSDLLSSEWPVRRDTRFALRVDSSEPVIAQATIGWTNTAGQFAWGARTRSRRVREVAKSYPSIRRLSRHWFYADGLVLKDGARQTIAELKGKAPPHTLWIRESEWAVLLNPGPDTVDAVLNLHYGRSSRHYAVKLPPERLKHVYMDDIAVPNRNYGVSVEASGEIAFQWLRMINWHDSSEPMSFWSVPGLPLDRAVAGPPDSVP